MKNLVVLFTVLTLILFSTIRLGSAFYTEDGQLVPYASGLTITSPTNAPYNSNSITLNVSFSIIASLDDVNVSYSLDGGNNSTVPLTFVGDPPIGQITYANGTTITGPVTFYPRTVLGEITLSELSEGTHNITVCAEYRPNNNFAVDRTSVCFTVNTTTPSASIPEPSLAPTTTNSISASTSTPTPASTTVNPTPSQATIPSSTQPPMPAASSSSTIAPQTSVQPEQSAEPAGTSSSGAFTYEIAIERRWR